MELLPFNPRHSPIIAAWIADQQALGIMTHQTVGSITSDLIEGWSRNAEAAYTLHENQDSLPLAYGLLIRDPNAGSLWASHLMVDPRMRGRGYGWTALQALGSMAMARGEEQLWGTVVAHNDYMRAMLGAMGWATHGTRVVVDPGSNSHIQVVDFRTALPLPSYAHRDPGIPTPGDEPGYGRGLRSG